MASEFIFPVSVNNSRQSPLMSGTCVVTIRSIGATGSFEQRSVAVRCEPAKRVCPNRTPVRIGMWCDPTYRCSFSFFK